MGNLHFNANYKLISIEFRNELNEKVYQRNPLQIQITFSLDMQCMNGILLPKLFWPTVRKKCSTDREKDLKFEAEGQEFANILRSL